MNFGLSVLIVSALTGASIDARYPGAVTAYECDFEEASDDDFDGWPHGWVRRRAPGYPHYLKMQLSREPSPRGKQCFRFDLDGGAAAASSPPIDYDRGSEYLVEASLKTIDLKRDEAYVALRFLAADGRIVQSEVSPRLRSPEWQSLRIGPVYCEHPEATQVVVELHLEPGDGRDLRGAALFDDVWIGKLPRKSLRGSQPFNVFHVGEPVELSVTLTSLTQAEIRARLDLFDREGKPVSSDEQISTIKFSPDGRPEPRTVTWRPPIREPGYYRGRVVISDRNGLLREDATALVVVEPIDRLRPGSGSFLGDFGWSILEARDVPQADDLHVLLYEAGVRRLKYPVWFGATNTPEARKILRFVERLNVQGVAVIGTLTPLPLSSEGRDVPDLAAAQTFRDARERWLPIVEPAMFDLAFKVRGWQLGHDRDLGFLALPGAADRIAVVKKEFDRIEQDSQLGVAWSWLQELPPTKDPAMRFLSLIATPEMTADELGQMLDGGGFPEGVQRWVGLSALSRHEYSQSDRVRDLVDRMIAAKAHGAAAVFFVDPFSAEHGLMERSGSPTELFLPWRTIAASLDGAQSAGSITLPNGSENKLFLRSEDAVLVVSADKPTDETISLDGKLRVTDLWEKQIVTHAHDPAAGNAPTNEPGTKFAVGPMPLVVTGIERGSAAWDVAMKLERAQLREVFGTPQQTALIVRNTYAQPVQGKLTFVAPEGWIMRPAAFDVSLGVGEEVRLPLEITLPTAGETGDVLLRIDHDVTADRRRQFAVYRNVRIGVGDVLLEVETRYVGDVLEVEQRLVNNSQSAVSFRFNLFAPNQRRMRTHVVDLPPGGIDVQSYKMPEGKSLQGKTLWIRAEEIGGNRVLSERFAVGEEI